jgi:predicted nucleic-acid-binding protein
MKSFLLKQYAGLEMLLAIDTNVLIRALVDDGTEQTELAIRRFVANDIYVSVSVLLETEWVLRSHLRLDRTRINDLFAKLAGTPRIEIERRQDTLRSIEAHRAGLDFADAVHLFSAGHCEALCTFDADFRRLARRIEATVKTIAP